MSSASRIWAVARYELTWDLRKKRTYIVVGLFLLAALVFGYLWPALWGRSVTTAQLQLGISFGGDLWWVAAVFLAFAIFVSGLFPLLIGGFTSADSLASEFDSRTIVLLFSQPVRRVEVYFGKFLAKVLLLLAVSILFTLLVLVLSEISVGAQTKLDMLPLAVLAEFGASLEFAALTFFIGSYSRSGAIVLGVLIALFIFLPAPVLFEFKFGTQEWMFLLPVANADFMLGHVIPWYIVQPSGVMMLQGGSAPGFGYAPPVAVSVVSALQYALAGLVANVIVPLVAGFYVFRRAEVKG